MPGFAPPLPLPPLPLHLPAFIEIDHAPEEERSEKEQEERKGRPLFMHQGERKKEKKVRWDRPGRSLFFFPLSEGRVGEAWRRYVLHGGRKKKEEEKES